LEQAANPSELRSLIGERVGRWELEERLRSYESLFHSTKEGQDSVRLSEELKQSLLSLECKEQVRHAVSFVNDSTLVT